jgi:phage FluMu protein Com
MVFAMLESGIFLLMYARTGTEMSNLCKKEVDHSRLSGDEIRIAVGYRIYELFCGDCNRVLIEEDSHLMRLRCKECKRIYAYRLHPEEEKFIFHYSTGKIAIQ